MTDDEIENVLQRIAARHFVTVARMRSDERNRWVTAAREAAAIELMKLGLTSAKVGEAMHRHPTTILSLQGRIGNRGGVSKPRPRKVWCAHCKADIRVPNVRGCLRKECPAKPNLPDYRKVFK